MLTIIKKLKVRYNNMYAAPNLNCPHVPANPISSSGGSQSDSSSHEMASNASDQPAEVQIYVLKKSRKT